MKRARRFNFVQQGAVNRFDWHDFRGVNVVDNNANLPDYLVPYAENVDFSRYIGAAAKRRGLEGLITSLGAGGVVGLHTYRHPSGERVLFGHGTSCYKLGGEELSVEVTSDEDWQEGTVNHVNISSDKINLARAEAFSDTTTLTADFNGTHSNTEAKNDAVSLLPDTDDYGPDFTGGAIITASEESTGYEGSKAFDNNESSYWWPSHTNNWIQVDLGDGVTKKARKLRIKSVFGAGAYCLKNFTLQGSNDGSTWTLIYSGVQRNNGNWQEYTFANDTAYRYYKIWCLSSYDTFRDIGIAECEIMEYVTLYKPLGVYTHGEIDISSALIMVTSKIEFNAIVPENCRLTVMLLVYNGEEWSTPSEISSGDSLGIAPDTDLTGYKVKWIATLETSDATVTPVLQDVTITITEEYLTEGEWLSPVYDLTNTPIIAALAWNQTIPEGTGIAWYVRGSVDSTVFGDWQRIVESGDSLPLCRYLQVRIKLTGTEEATPAVNDFTISYETGFTTATSIKTGLTGNRIRFVDWNRKCWFTEGGRPQVYDGTTVRDVGIDPPATAPTIAASGSGSFTGTYKARVTFINKDGAESNASEEGSVSASSAGQFDWTNIPVGDASITARRLYRTKAGGEIFYYVTTLNDNETATYTDTVADTGLTTEMLINNDIPPDSAIIYEHKNYMFYVPSADKTKLYYSKVGLPDSVPLENFEQFPYEINGLCTYADQLIVCSDHFTKAINGSVFDADPTVGDYSIRDIDSIGAVSHEAMVECIEPEFRNILLFPVRTGIKFLTPGLQEKSLEAVPISRSVQPYFVNAKRRDYMTAIFHDNCYFIAFNWYAEADTPVGHNNCVMKMDMRTREWTGIWTINCSGFCVANGQLYMADATKGQVYLHSGSDDDGESIKMVISSKYIGDDKKRDFKKLRLAVKRGSDTANTVITTRVDGSEGTINVGANAVWAGAGGNARTVQDEVVSPEFSVHSARGHNFGWNLEDESKKDLVIYGVTVRAEPPI